jgi:hypothetical protein
MNLVNDKLQQEGLSPEFQKLLIENPAITFMLWLLGCLELYPSGGC